MALNVRASPFTPVVIQPWKVKMPAKLTPGFTALQGAGLVNTKAPGKPTRLSPTRKLNGALTPG